MSSDQAPAAPFASRTLQRYVSFGALAVTLAGLVLFAYTIQRAGVRATIDNILSMGIGGFAIILVLSGIRLMVRSLAWVWCVEGTQPLSLGAAFEASLIGEALGNLTPFGTFISEPSKAIVVRSQVPIRAALSGIAVENIFYVLTLNVVIALGALTFLLNFSADAKLQESSFAALAGVAVCIGVALAVIFSGATPLSTVLTWVLQGWKHHEWQRHLLERVQMLETRIYSFYGRHRRKLLPLLALEATFHLCGIAEVFVTLSFIQSAVHVTLVHALILESIGRVINIIFKFVPFKFGVDEWGAETFAKVIGLGEATGVTLAIVRKARIICWTGVGLLLLARRGLTIRTVLRDAETVTAKP